MPRYEVRVICKDRGAFNWFITRAENARVASNKVKRMIASKWDVNFLMLNATVIRELRFWQRPWQGWFS